MKITKRTITVCHMGGESFLATNRFFKRFRSQEAVVSALEIPKQ